MNVETEMRIEALRLAVATTGHSQKVLLAEQYLEFLKGAKEPQELPAMALKRKGPK